MSKASKFQMVDPTEGGLVQAMMADEVNKRMGKAVEDLADKYGKGGRSVETSESGPTGAAYQVRDAALAEDARLRREEQRRQDAIDSAAAAQRAEEIEGWRQQQLNEDEDSDDELLRELEDTHDAELEKIRNARMAELRRSHNETQENLARGHGQYREIAQDDFLPEVTGGSLRVLVHFYHGDFEKCQLMDQKLRELAGRHIETKFLRLNAEKAPFFVQKLAVRTLPTVVYFEDGVAVSRQTGFEGIDMEGGNCPAHRLAERLGAINAIDYTPPPTEEEFRGIYGRKMAEQMNFGLQEIGADDFEGDGITATLEDA